MPSQTTNDLAKVLRSLHQPSNPVIFTNIYDGITASAVASLPQTKALATASYAVALAAGITDDTLDLQTNLSAVTSVAKVAKQHGLPLTADFQDGYGDQLEKGVKELINLGVVGINLEDAGRESKKEGELYPINVAAERIKRALNTAREAGVPDFVINARTDCLVHGQPLSEAIERGKAYLEAGAANVFVWGGSVRGGTTREEVKELVDAFGGKLNVIMILEGAGQGKGLSVKELKDIGVARISVGPQLALKGAKVFGEEAAKALQG